MTHHANKLHKEFQEKYGPYFLDKKMKFEKDEWYQIEGKDYQFVEKLESRETYWEAHWLFYNKSNGGVNLIAELKGNYYDLSHKEIEVKKIKEKK